MIEEIRYKEKTYAIVIRHTVDPNNTEFYTPKECEIQMGIVAHKAGYIEPPHIHKQVKRTITDTTEVLHMTDGEARINFFDKDGNIIGATILKEGDTILLIGNTGHNLEAITDMRGVKAKQGPYVSMEEDKILL